MPILHDGIEDYARAHTTAVPDLYERLRERTRAETDLPQMQVGQLEGRLLKILAQLSGAELAVEVGCFTGYSALSIAEGLPDGARLITCDIDEDTAKIAREFFAEAPWGHKIELRLGPAIETLAGIDGPIGFAFVDADKASYRAYWDALVPKLRPGGLILVDNVLWSGSVLAPEKDSAKAIAAFNDHVAADDRVEKVMLTVRDGIFLGRKR